MDNRLHVGWTHGLEGDDLKNFRARVNGAIDIFDKLRYIISREFGTKYSNVSRNLENPNWINAVAFAEGYKAALEDVAKILPKGPTNDQ